LFRFPSGVYLFGVTADGQELDREPIQFLMDTPVEVAF
jgi:hypothetical protein